MDKEDKPDFATGNIVSATDTRRTIVSRYPEKWRKCCLQIIHEYRNQLSDLLRRNVGWPTVHNAFAMSLADNDLEKAEVIKNVEFQRTLFSDWTKGEMVLGEHKFSLIDRFVQKELLDNNSLIRKSADRVIEFRVSEQSRSLFNLMHGEWKNDRLPKSLHEIPLEERAFVCTQFESGYVPIVYFQKKNEFGIPAVIFYVEVDKIVERESCQETYRAIYSEPPLHQVIFDYADGILNRERNEIPSDKYFGYFIPLSRKNNDWRGVMINFYRKLFDGSEPDFFNTTHVIFKTFGSNFDLRDAQSTLHPDFVFNLGDRNHFRFHDDEKETKSGDVNHILKIQAGFLEVQVSDNMKSKLNSLKDEYLLW